MGREYFPTTGIPFYFPEGKIDYHDIEVESTSLNNSTIVMKAKKI